MRTAQFSVHCIAGHIEVMNIRKGQLLQALVISFTVIVVIIGILYIFLFIYVLLKKKCPRSKRRIENCHQASEIREPRDSQEDVWSISIPETKYELPSYENPEKPPGYWTLYNQRGQRQGATGGGDHLRLQGLQGEIRVDEQGRAYVMFMLDTEPEQRQRDPAG